MAIFIPTYFIMARKVDKEIQKIKDIGEPYSLKQIIPPPVPKNENADVFALLQKAYQMPKCRFDLDYEKGNATKMPNFVAIRDIINLIVLYDAFLMRDEHYQEAVNLTAYGLRCARFINKWPVYFPLIYHMIQIACESSLYQPLNCLAENNIAVDYTPALNEINSILEELKDAMARAMETERVMVLDAFEKGFPPGYNSIFEGIRDVSPKLKVSRDYLIYINILNYLKDMEKIINYLKQGDLKNSRQDMPKVWQLPKWWRFDMLMSSIYIPNIYIAPEHHCKTMDNYTQLKPKLEELNKIYQTRKL